MKKRPEQDRRINKIDRRQNKITAATYPLRVFLERSVEIEARKADARARMTDAVNSIAEHIVKIGLIVSVNLPHEKKPKKRKDKYTAEQRAVLKKIFKLRQQNMTYDKIAQYLKKKYPDIFKAWYLACANNTSIVSEP